jgi:hypothetical protein
MTKSGLACCVFTMAVLVTQVAQNQPNAEKQASHSEIPGGGGLGDHRWNDLYSDRSISVPNQRAAATGRPPYGWGHSPGVWMG